MRYKIQYALGFGYRYTLIEAIDLALDLSNVESYYAISVYDLEVKVATFFCGQRVFPIPQGKALVAVA